MGVQHVPFRSPALMNMQCLLQISPTTLLLGGHQNVVVEFDVESRKEIRQVIGTLNFIY